MWCNVSESGYISVECTGKRFVVRISSLHTLRWVHDKVQILWLNLLSFIAPSPRKTLPLPFRVFNQPLHVWPFFVCRKQIYDGIAQLHYLIEKSPWLSFLSVIFPEFREWDKQSGCFDQSSAQYRAEAGEGRPLSLSQDNGTYEGAWDFCRKLEGRGSREETAAHAVIRGSSVPDWGRDGL